MSDLDIEAEFNTRCASMWMVEQASAAAESALLDLFGMKVGAGPQPDEILVHLAFTDESGSFISELLEFVGGCLAEVRPHRRRDTLRLRAQAWLESQNSRAGYTPMIAAAVRGYQVAPAPLVASSPPPPNSRHP